MKRLLLPDFRPQIASSAYIAEGSVLTGQVSIGPESSFWFGCVARGDINLITIGRRSNIQDGTIIHVADDYPAIIGNEVSVGHRAIIHACEIGDGCLIGMGAVIMDGTVLGAGCTVAAGSLVTKHQKIPPGSLVMGSPAKVVRPLTPQEIQQNLDLAEKYVQVSRRYLELASQDSPSIQHGTAS